MVGIDRAVGTLAPGVVAALAVASSVAASLFALLWQSSSGEFLSAIGHGYVWRAVQFTLLQAGISTGLSVALGLILARSLARLGRFAWRGPIMTLLSMPIVMPSLIAIFGLVAIYGNNGAFVALARQAGWDLEWNIYGLTGILIAHVFFNLPLAMRLLLPAWNSIPAETLRLSSQLGIKGFAFFRLIEWPILRRYLPRASATIFLLCATSFAVVLTLGGGPRAATLEVLIFQALHYDADPVTAAHLAILGMALTFSVIIAALCSARESPLGTTLATDTAAPPRGSRSKRWPDWLVLAVVLLGLFPPLGAVIFDGLGGLASGVAALGPMLRALATSLAIAIPASAVSTVLAFAVASGEASARRGGSRWAARIAVCGVTPISLSPMALALGFYLLFRNLGDSRGISLLGIALTNALLSTPFLVATLRPAIELAGERHHHLCSALGIAGLRRWRIVDWPTLRGAIATAAALGLAFSLGDLVAVSLYGDPAIRTLSLLLYDQLSAYRMDGAAATALFLMLVVFISYRALERVIGGRHAT